MKVVRAWVAARSHHPPIIHLAHSFTASFPVFIKLLKELREMGYGVLSAQFGKHEWSLNTQLTWSTSAVLNADDEIIEKYITVGGGGWLGGELVLARLVLELGFFSAPTIHS